MSNILTIDQRWAQQMADEQARDLFRAMLTAESRADGVLEFGASTPGEKVLIDRETRDEIPKLVDALLDLYNGSKPR